MMLSFLDVEFISGYQVVPEALKLSTFIRRLCQEYTVFNQRHVTNVILSVLQQSSCHFLSKTTEEAHIFKSRPLRVVT